jgi:hypothetical protein
MEAARDDLQETSRARILVFRNDPGAIGEAPVPSEPPLDTERSPWGFRVEASRPEPREYPTDTPEFLYWQMAAALERGRKLWSRLLPQGGLWIPGPVLPAVPVEGAGLNAFYDRRSIRFFRDVNSETGAIVHSGDSPDIVTHEEGHAVLDALRPDLWDAPHLEVAAFHEAFGDIAAILVAFDEPALVGAVVEETRGALAQSNLVSRVAEELAAAARSRFGPGVALPGALRDAVNGFQYADPRSLPDDAPATSLSAEPHSFCRVFTGLFWDLLVLLYAERGGGGGRNDESALSLAAEEAGRLFAAASEGAGVGADYLARVSWRIPRDLRDQQRMDLAVKVEELLAGRELSRPADAAPMTPDEDRTVRVSEGEAPVPEAVLRAVRSRLGDDPGEILLRAPTEPRRLRGRRVRDLFLFGREYGPADGAAVEISDSFSFLFGDAGFLVASRMLPSGDADAEDARSFVRFLARRGRIAPEGRFGARPAELFREGFSHAVVTEPDGIRRLRRVWVDRPRTARVVRGARRRRS